MQEKVGTGITRQMTRHPLLPGPLAVHDATDTWLTLHDPRHNLLSVADSTGTVAAGDTLRYEPFGKPSASTTAAGIEPRFGGMRWLVQAGLYLSDSRLMDPKHGAWLSPDPLGTIDSPNLYSYARQNPIDFIDPSGLGTGPLEIVRVVQE